MPKIQYEALTFSRKTAETIEAANRIITTYRAQGYDLTLRQLYYQFVSRDLIPNKQNEYKRLGDVISKARRAGLVDWTAIVDRTRSLRGYSSWDSPDSIVRSAASSFRRDPWEHQPAYVEVWFEKDALAGVFSRACERWRVPHFSTRGYSSDSEVWSAAQRLLDAANDDKEVVVLHFGDHDPSGIDMTRDIEERLALFGVEDLTLNRLALNMEQVQAYNPPPNPAKETDSRFSGYRRLYGNQSWELDALEPRVLAKLVEDHVGEFIDDDAWDDVMERERQDRETLARIADGYDKVVASLGDGEG